MTRETRRCYSERPYKHSLDGIQSVLKTVEQDREQETDDSGDGTADYLSLPL